LRGRAGASADFPGEVLGTQAAAKIILQRLTDAGFKVTVDEHAAGMREVRLVAR
jgi:hypothetical protein